MFKKLKSILNGKEEMNKMKKETNIWDDLKVTESEFDKFSKVYQHAEIDYTTWTDLINALFPDSKENRVKAWSLFVSGIKQGEINKEK